jgi:uncharacterized membrane protein
MHLPTLLQSALAFAAAVAAPSVSSAQVTLEYIEPPSGYYAVAAYGCSGSGDTLAVTMFGPLARGLAWPGGKSATLLEPLIATQEAFAFGLSADGTTIVGESSLFGSGPATQRAVVWRNGLPPQDLGTLPGDFAGRAVAANANGSVVIGLSEYYAGSGQLRGFRWNASSGMTELFGVGAGVRMLPSDISDSGSVIVGAAGGVACIVEIAPAGSDALALGVLPGMLFSSAEGVSGDGETVVGSSSSYFSSRPFVWTAKSGMAELPGPSGSVRANDVSNGGRTIVGDRSTSSETLAVAWGEGIGFVDLNSYLDAEGVSREGDSLLSATGVSHDGRTIVGYTLDGKAFRIRNFNAPPAVEGDIDGDGAVDAEDLSILLANWGGGGAADLNGDGTVDGSDLAILLANWS